MQFCTHDGLLQRVQSMSKAHPAAAKELLKIHTCTSLVVPAGLVLVFLPLNRNTTGSERLPEWMHTPVCAPAQPGLAWAASAEASRLLHLRGACDRIPEPAPCLSSATKHSLILFFLHYCCLQERPAPPSDPRKLTGILLACQKIPIIVRNYCFSMLLKNWNPADQYLLLPQLLQNFSFVLFPPSHKLFTLSEL